MLCASPIMGVIKNIITASLTPIPPGAPGIINPATQAIENMTTSLAVIIKFIFKNVFTIITSNKPAIKKNIKYKIHKTKWQDLKLSVKQWVPLLIK